MSNLFQYVVLLIPRRMTFITMNLYRRTNRLCHAYNRISIALGVQWLLLLTTTCKDRSVWRSKFSLFLTYRIVFLVCFIFTERFRF